MSDVPSLLALRPVSTVHRLEPRSEACPLSLRHLAGALATAGMTMPVFAAPFPAIARAALVAAKGARAVVGLSLPARVEPEPWFAVVARAADELAPRVPFFVSGEVTLEGDAGIESGFAASHRLLEAGVTHLAVDVSAVSLPRRAEAAARIAGLAAEREIAVDCALPASDGAPDVDEAIAYLEEFEGFGVRADVVSVRCRAPADAAAAGTEARALAALGAAIVRPILRRGLLPDAAVAAVRSARLCAVEDGGRALAAGARAARSDAAARAAAGEGDGKAGPLSPEAANRVEALAYAEASALLEALGAAGSAPLAEAALTARRR
jgi:hypothetical protein